jgi:hypothetical protein
MFNHLKKLVNKAKAMGSKKWTDRMLTEHKMRAYTPMNYNMVALIHQDPAYKRMSSNDVLDRIMNHEMYIEEANHVKNLSKGITTSRKQEIIFKANKKSKNKQEVVESSSEEKEEEEDSSECDDEDMALFMKKFKKYIKKKFGKGNKKLKTTTKRTCYNCGKHDHFIANCPFESRDDGDDKKKYKPCKKDKCYKISDKPYKKSPMVKLTSGKNGSPKMRAPNPIVMVWHPWLSRESHIQASLSSQSLIKERTLALWQRKTSVRYKPRAYHLLNTSLAMILMMMMLLFPMV